MAYIENKTFDEIQIGEMAIIIRHLSNRDIEIFASVSGNQNPTHTDIEYMKSKSHGHLLGHGMWIGAVFSAILGMKLPGPGTRYISQTLQFHNSAKAGDTVTATARVLEKNAINNTVTLECTCVNQAGLSIASGIAEVIAPVEKIKRTVVELPSIILQEKEDEWYNQLIHLPDNTVPLITAIVHPVDETSLVGAVFAATENLIIPILVGPESRIRQKADELKLDISPYTIISTEHSHASAERAVQMARMGEVEALMKGNLHTDELLSFVVDRASGLRGNRRMSHVFAVQAPDYPKPIFLTDAALNIKPNLETKKDIVQNAVDLFTRIGHGIPKVAIVSAVETVTEKIPSTLDATALCKMAERGQITGAVVDGPLGFDNAVSKESADIKGIVSDVAGNADIIIVPDIESGNMLYKQMTVMSGMDSAGIVLGAKVPIILTSRSSNKMSRKASSALALLYCRNQGKF